MAQHEKRQSAKGCQATACALARRLLMERPATPVAMDVLLAEVAAAFAADGAGLWHPSGQTAHQRTGSGTLALPWPDDAMQVRRVTESLSPISLFSAGRHYLCASAGEARILWLEFGASLNGDTETPAAFGMLALALGRRLALEERGWPAPIGQRSLEEAVVVARKTAHTYSNILTSILGYVEMSLAQAPPNSTLRRYLDIAFRGAQQGVQLTQRLQLLGCKATASSHGVALLPALARQVGKRSICDPRIEETVDVPPDLPLVALSSEQLTVILDTFLDNAHEALPQGGRVAVQASLVTPHAEEARAVWGRMMPGLYIRLDVTDSGEGVSPEARTNLFQQPYFTTKHRHHGLGLTIVHSILTAHRGGVCLLDEPRGGTTARAYLPVFATSGAPAPERNSYV